MYKSLIRKVITKLYHRFSIQENSTSEILLDKFYGHNISKGANQSINIFREPIPWFSYPAIDFISQFDLSNKTVFEWGSGNSSIFFAKRCKKVTSVEHDKNWYNISKNKLLENQNLIFSELAEYHNAIHTTNEKFDIIIIDGQRRFDCARESIRRLNEGGIIIIDNSDWFYISCNYIKKKLDLIQIDFCGFSPINEYVVSTSIFFSRNSNLKTLSNRQPNELFGGLKHDEYEIIKSEDKIFKTDNHSFLIDTID